MLIKSTLILACAAVALARDAVLSRGIFLGEDTSNPEDPPEQIFAKPKNHAMAAASIMRYAGDQVRFTPHDSSPAELNKVFDDWLNAVGQFKGFRMASPPMAGELKLEGGRDKVREQLLHRIEWMSDADIIANEVAGMIPESNDDRDLKDFALNLLIIQQPEIPHDGGFFFGGGGHGRYPNRSKDKVLVRMLTLELKLDTAFLFKWVTVPDQTAYITYTEREVDKMYMAKNAERLAEKTEKSMTDVESMMWYFTSPKKFAFSEDLESHSDQFRFMYPPYRQGEPRLLEWLRL